MIYPQEGLVDGCQTTCTTRACTATGVSAGCLSASTTVESVAGYSAENVRNTKFTSEGRRSVFAKTANVCRASLKRRKGNLQKKSCSKTDYLTATNKMDDITIDN